MSKPAGYYAEARADLVAELPRPLGRVLDVGCGEGNVGRALRAAGAAEVHGIEVMPAAAAQARESLDSVFAGTVEAALESDTLPDGFDTVCCYDVLEHLVDPAIVLRGLRARTVTGGHLHISIPNARHFSLVYDLVVRGTFGYAEYGHRDATHLHWVTRRDLVALVESTGWRVLRVAGDVAGGRNAQADRLTRGKAREFLALQWRLLATTA
ncbi:MAG TPA: class I SAM-dependent methyltransferase [Solirubrobacter sp.]|nr:class I SAM-dependent methyltransferase [Solirubrobacter sp.]